MISTQAQVALGVTGGLFLAYCVYFDHKRRSAPDFRAKLKAKRERQRQEKKSSRPNYPDMRDEAAVQRYFLEEIQLGEELLVRGEMEDAVTHLANAVVASGQPMQILNLLKHSLPPEVFKAVAEKYPAVARDMMRASGIPVVGGGAGPGSMTSGTTTKKVSAAKSATSAKSVLQDDDDLE
ncbi:mitochondrial import receptor subunit TOM20 homolog [Convolutriloba macropyga]|uniref:mitochondrial import receptor subunit TOM20 homolog n=1 Tax=Convolutriloba macropyga TaxID=536237 RepID=UPI003F51AD8D